MHLSESIHFTAITVWSGGDGAHFSQKHGAFLSSEVSFLERLERHFFCCVYRHGQYFITSLFTWSKTRSSAVPVGDTASCLWSGICDPQLKTQKEYPTVQVFLEVAQWQKNMGICGYLAVPGKCLFLLGLKLLFLVPAGVPARSGDSVLKDNITVRQGDSAVLK